MIWRERTSNNRNIKTRFYMSENSTSKHHGVSKHVSLDDYDMERLDKSNSFIVLSGSPKGNYLFFSFFLAFLTAPRLYSRDDCCSRCCHGMCLFPRFNEVSCRGSRCSCQLPSQCSGTVSTLIMDCSTYYYWYYPVSLLIWVQWIRLDLIWDQDMLGFLAVQFHTQRS